MRPLWLSIAGLHSYRQQQEIDFARLSAQGVFGIFGPTGSGKSSILDAITLALYGQVERAPAKTQGILHAGADRLYTAFTFSLACGSEREVFRVERLYRGGDEEALRQNQCRLVRLASPQEFTVTAVLAEKSREVTQAVEQLLGLDAQDFTRAVVLPQGKFAEFLSLRGAERRRMLQRLFGLHQYGDALANALRDRLAERSQELNQVQGQQEGLGAASPDDVAAAAAALETAEAAQANLKEECESTAKQCKEAEAVWAAQEELGKTRSKLQQHRQAEDEMKQLRIRLDQAKRAEVLRRPLEQHALATEARDAAETERQSAAAAQAAKAQVKQEADERLKQVRQTRMGREPDLREQEQRFTQALEIEQTLAQQQEQEAAATAELAALQEEHQQLKKQQEDLIHERDQLVQQLLEVSNGLQQARVAPAEREQVQQAAERLADIERRQQACADVSAEYHKAQAAAAEAESGAAEVEAQWQQLHEQVTAMTAKRDRRQSQPPVSTEALQRAEQELEQLHTAIQTLAPIEEQLAQADQAWSELNEQCCAYAARTEALAAEQQQAQQCQQEQQEQFEAAQMRQREAERAAMAAVLAEQLADDTPCPVCGSTEHPQPMAARPELAACEQELKAAQARAVASQTKLAEVQAQQTESAALHKQTRAQLKQQGRAWRTLEEKACMQRQALPQEHQQASLNQLQQGSQQAKHKLQEQRQALEDWRTGLEALTAKLDTLREQRAAVKADLAAAKQHCEHSKTRVDELKQASRKSREELTNAEAAYAALASPWEPEAVPLQLKQLQQRDEQYEVLQEQQNQLTLQQSQVQAARESIGQQSADAGAGIREQQVRLEQLQSNLQAQKTSLQALTGGRPAGTGLTAVREELDRLAKEQTEAEQQQEQAAAACQQQELRLAAAETTRANAKQAWQRSEADIAALLAQQGMSDREQARFLLLDASDQAAGEQRWQEYHQQEQLLTAEVARLEGVLAGRQLAASAWEELKQRYATVQQEYQQAVESTAAARQALSELKRKRKQWQELEKRRKTLAGEVDQLNSLRELTRANAFVEFVAEEKLLLIAQEASARLAQLTRSRYALEVDGDGAFVIRDDDHGGIRRRVSSLSGGETFLASLALALALSAQVQLKGQHPLEFFFLDEGFGSLDSETLDMAMATLEQLQQQQLVVGVISHVPEIRARLPYRLEVHPPTPTGDGTTLTIEQG